MYSGVDICSWSALNVLWEQHKAPAVAIDYIIEESLFPWTNSFKQLFLLCKSKESFLVKLFLINIFSDIFSLGFFCVCGFLEFWGFFLFTD